MNYDDNAEFNFLVYPKMIFFKKALKNGVTTFSEVKGKKLLKEYELQQKKG